MYIAFSFAILGYVSCGVSRKDAFPDEEEINKMKADAEMNAEDDRKQYELVTARNEGETMSYQVEKMMKENEDIPEADNAARLDADFALMSDAVTSLQERILALFGGEAQ